MGQRAPIWNPGRGSCAPQYCTVAGVKCHSLSIRHCAEHKWASAAACKELLLCICNTDVRWCWLETGWSAELICPHLTHKSLMSLFVVHSGSQKFKLQHNSWSFFLHFVKLNSQFVQIFAENSPRSLKNPEINPVLYSGQTGPLTAPLTLSNLRSTNIHQAPSSSSDFFFFSNWFHRQKLLLWLQCCYLLLRLCVYLLKPLIFRNVS